MDSKQPWVAPQPWGLLSRSFQWTQPGHFSPHALSSPPKQHRKRAEHSRGGSNGQNAIEILLEDGVLGESLGPGGPGSDHPVLHHGPVSRLVCYHLWFPPHEQNDQPEGRVVT